MESLEILTKNLEEVLFTAKPGCIEALHNRLQDIIFHLEAREPVISGELIGLRSCAWVLHERYYMDTEDQLLWTFHHTKHKILRSCNNLMERENLRRKLKHAKESGELHLDQNLHPTEILEA